MRFQPWDLDAVFALFADRVEYVSPPPLYDGPTIAGWDAVTRFWDQVSTRFAESRITNLSIEEAAPGHFVRNADLVHCGRGVELHYRIRQTTELSRGRVVRQVNALLL